MRHIYLLYKFKAEHKNGNTRAIFQIANQYLTILPGI